MPLFEVFLPDHSKWAEDPNIPLGWERDPNSPVEATDTEAAVRAVGRPVNSYLVREAGSLDSGDRFDIFEGKDGIRVIRVPPRRPRRRYGSHRI
jgi:hypothetical protein